MNADGDQKPKAVTPYVKVHGSIVTSEVVVPPPPGERSGEQIVTNQADDPFDADKIREHMEGDDD
jgi:hypothetical protein